MLLVLCYNWILCRYVQNKLEYYYLSIGLIKYTYYILKRLYKSLFQYLDGILIGEGFLSDESCIGSGPYMTFVITRDFNCRPHQVEDDYNFGFVIWLHEGNRILPSYS